MTTPWADREKSRNEAQIYANNLIPNAQGEALAVIRAAQHLQQRCAEAIGDTERFFALFDEYEKAPELTRARLYLEAIERVLPGVQIYIDRERGRVPLNLRVGKP